MPLDKNEISDLDAAANILLDAQSTDDWRKCNMLLQTSAGIIESIANCLQHRQLAAESTGENIAAINR